MRLLYLTGKQKPVDSEQAMCFGKDATHEQELLNESREWWMSDGMGRKQALPFID